MGLDLYLYRRNAAFDPSKPYDYTHNNPALEDEDADPTNRRVGTGYAGRSEDTHIDWSYGGFHEFRSHIADTAGFYLGDMKGYGGTRPWSVVDQRLVPFLNHSDCDGYLLPEECAAFLPALREIIPQMLDEYHRKRAGDLARFLERAIQENLVVVFS